MAPVKLEVAERQYRTLPAELQTLVDHRLAELVENPTQPPDAVYNQRSDQWSIPLAEHGFLFYAVVHTPQARVIVLRLIAIN